MSDLVLVAGATGGVGRLVVRQTFEVIESDGRPVQDWAAQFAALKRD